MQSKHIFNQNVEISPYLISVGKKKKRKKNRTKQIIRNDFRNINSARK